MDWLRRNWPDLLIGVALIAVIAGIIATLISGGSFFPANNRSVETPDQGSTPLTSTTTPGAAGGQADAGAADAAVDGAVDAADASADAAQLGQSGALTPNAAAGENAAADDAAANAAADDAGPNAGAAGEPASSNDSLPVAVLPPGQAPQSAGAGATPSGTPARSTVTSTAANAQAAAVLPAADVSASALVDAPYRVSVGAYGNRDNAQRQLEAFEAAGYPVFMGSQGTLSIVLVGPYDTEAEARSVAARIRTADMGVSDPTVYEFTPDEAAQATSAGASAAVSANPASDAAAAVQGGEAAAVQDGEALAAGADDDTVITSAPSTAPGVRYLQVGAYANRDSSLPQRDRLEGLGFVVTERVESELVKLLIGPFDAANLSNAQGRLEAAGIASFPR